jgi:hypothetical protein
MPDDYWVEVDLVHKYRYIGGPIENPQQNQEILSAIGLAAVSWARMEQHIDAILQQINKEHHSNADLRLFDPDHPRPFSAKLRLLKNYFNKHPGLASHTETVRDFVTGLKKLAVDRNEILHGVLQDFDPQSKRYTINGVTYRKATNDFFHRHQVNDLERIHNFTKLVNLAHYGLCDVSRDLFTVDGVARLQMPKPPSRHWWRRFLDWLFR